MDVLVVRILGHDRRRDERRGAAALAIGECPFADLSRSLSDRQGSKLSVRPRACTAPASRAAVVVGARPGRTCTMVRLPTWGTLILVLATALPVAAQTPPAMQRDDRPSTSGARGIAVADFNGDGWPDIAEALHGPNG